MSRVRAVLSCSPLSRSRPRASPRPSYRAGGAFFHLVISSSFAHLILPPSRHLIVSSRLVPRVGYSGAYGVSSCSSSRASSRPSFRMKQGDGARRPVSSCPCGGYLVAPSHLIPSRSSSWYLVSSGVSSRSHQMRASKQDDKGVSSRSRRPVPSSVRRAGRP